MPSLPTGTRSSAFATTAESGRIAVGSLSGFRVWRRTGSRSKPTGYLGQEGRSALRLAASYELLLTQKLVLQPRIEASLYGKSDPERELGSGLSTVTTGLRLRYEVGREFAPYAGIEWSGKFGGTADFARAAGAPARETRLVAGVRFWF